MVTRAILGAVPLLYGLVHLLSFVVYWRLSESKDYHTGRHRSPAAIRWEAPEHGSSGNACSLGNIGGRVAGLRPAPASKPPQRSTSCRPGRPFWMFWHAPTFVFEEAFSELSLVRAFGWALLLVAGSVMLTWLYNGTGGSLLIPILFHGTQDLTLASIAARGEALNAGWAALFLALTVAIVLWAGPAGLSRSGKRPHTAPSRSPGNHGKSGGQR
jgi:hypothetical protein